MVFFINSVNASDIPTSYDEHQVGLFTNNEWKGEGNCCGWYGAEYYLNTTLLAYAKQLVPRNRTVQYTYPFDGGVIECNKHYDKIMIGSAYCEEKFEASSIKEAIQIFKEQRWEQFKTHKNS